MTLVGLVLMPAPGPGIIVVMIGFGLLASEFAVIGRWLDRGELKLRAAGRSLEAGYVKFRRRIARYQPEHLPPISAR